MIDEEKPLAAESAEGDRYRESLMYDLGKFLTTLSLLAIGGVLTIADAADPADVKPANIILITLALSAAAVIAASTASTIAVDRWTAKPIRPRMHLYILATVALLGMGLGMFIFMWIDKLN